MRASEFVVRGVRSSARTRVAIIAIVFACVTLAAAQAPKNDVRKAYRGAPASTTTVSPTVDEASKFLADAEARLIDLGVKGQRAAWVQENFITADTEQIAADANQALNALSVELAKKAKRFDGVTLPPVMARKRLLLKLAAGFPAPSDPAEQKESADFAPFLQTFLASEQVIPEERNEGHRHDP